MLKSFLKNKKQTSRIENNLNQDNIPYHVAIIMDGNGRWAKSKGLPRVAGHRAGMKSIREITRAANEIGIGILTLYAFSTENWKRPEKEVKFLMDLPQEFLLKDIDELVEKNVKINIIGFRDKLPEHTLKAVFEAENRTKNNTGLILNFALNYGSRNEILNATKAIIKSVSEGHISQNEINEELFNKYLLTKEFPDPDLLIRTSGEQRISNFLLWQLAYSELWFTSVYWPEFNKELFVKAINEYQHRSRRYGGVEIQETDVK